MAEGLAAISLAGNIIQFISFSFVLVSKTKELHQSVSGTLNENVDLEIISQDIRTLSNSMTASAYSTGPLSEIAHRCDTIAKELLDAVTKLHRKYGPRSGNLPTRWQSFRRALESVWGKAHIEELKARLVALRDQVTMHLVSDTNNNQVRLMDLLEAWKKKNMQTGYEITAQIQKLDVQLQATQRSISDHCSDVISKTFHDQFSRLSSRVHQVSRSHMIIASLRYDCMEIRQSAIKDAHIRTFAWMYSHEETDSPTSRPNTRFTQWLQRDNGIYWITGKPGAGKSTLMKYIHEHDETMQNLRVWCGHAPLVRACFYFWKPGQQMQKSLEGLLQSLLHHILHACPELASTICPERWHAESPSQPHSSISPIPWTLPELQKSIALFRTQTTVATKFYFQVDGLDEYYGDSWDVIETMRDLSAAPNVKLCLSSRPWNCFQRSFGQENPYVLRIHDFTRPDIELFARETLLRSYRGCVDFEANVFEELIKDIGERAQGVFLWVRLVVRSLRDGIVNEDSVSLLQERLHAIPSDLEEFFEQILRSVETIYRSRMARTFLTAMRSPVQLKLIHYYFLEQGDTTFGFDMPSKIWTDSRIQRRALQTERRLNGRFKGLLEAASTVAVSAETKVDFLHRSLCDFLATERMRDKLQYWASQELNVFTSIGRALIAESKFIDKHSCLSTLRLAVELASYGTIETGDTEQCFAIISQAELENERTRPSHSSCELNCGILRFAATVGRADYLKYRVLKHGACLNLNRILKHSIACPAGSDGTYDYCLRAANGNYDKPVHFKDRSILPVSEATGDVVLPRLVKQLFELGADPNTLVDGVSSWTAFAQTVTQLRDCEEEEEWWSVLDMFLEQDVDVSKVIDSWSDLLHCMDATTGANRNNTLRCFKRLFSHGLNPNAVTRHSTLTKELIQLASRDTHYKYGSSNELMHEFLRHGADVSTVYKDTMLNDDRSPRGWYQNVCQQLELYRQTSTKSLSFRVSQYRVFLEHGLDPNAVTPSGSTLWGGLLEAMHSVDQNSVHGATFDKCLRDLLVFSLQYGADPFVPTILRLLKRFQNFMSAHIFGLIETTLKTEISQRKSQNRYRSRTQPRSDGQSKRGLPISFKSPPPFARQKTRQVKKRDHGDTSHIMHNPKSKRGRLS